MASTNRIRTDSSIFKKQREKLGMTKLRRPVDRVIVVVPENKGNTGIYSAVSIQRKRHVDGVILILDRVRKRLQLQINLHIILIHHSVLLTLFKERLACDFSASQP